MGLSDREGSPERRSRRGRGVAPPAQGKLPGERGPTNALCAARTPRSVQVHGTTPTPQTPLELLGTSIEGPFGSSAGRARCSRPGSPRRSGVDEGHGRAAQKLARARESRDELAGGYARGGEDPRGDDDGTPRRPRSPCRSAPPPPSSTSSARDSATRTKRWSSAPPALVQPRTTPLKDFRSVWRTSGQQRRGTRVLAALWSSAREGTTPPTFASATPRLPRTPRDRRRRTPRRGTRPITTPPRRIAPERTSLLRRRRTRPDPRCARRPRRRLRRRSSSSASPRLANTSRRSSSRISASRRTRDQPCRTLTR